MLLVEVQLSNKGAAPVAIEHYSAEGATMSTDNSKTIFKVFTIPGRPPAATTDLTQTLQPGESTTINMTFPLPASARIVSLSVPKIGPLEGIKLEPTDWEPGAARPARNRDRRPAPPR